jgi:uncharacterized protein
MEMTTHALGWFEIPVRDFTRARAFYSAIFDYDMPEMSMGPNRMGIFLHEQGKGVGGAIVQGNGYVPGASGVRVYLAGGKDLQNVLNRIDAAGGKVVHAKTEVAPGMGYFAFFEDTEGNLIGLQSAQ